MSGKIIVVTGAKGLIGQAITSFIRSKGNRVIEADIQTETDLANDQYKLDITSEVSINDCLKAIIDSHGRIDGWVNSAYPRTPDWGNFAEEVPFESWRKNIDMHLNGYYLCCQKVLIQMALQKSGSVVNLSSIYGVQAPDFTLYEGTGIKTSPVAYAAIKGGIINLTKYFASYYGKVNVRVNCVSPGGILDKQDERFIKKYNEKVPMQRLGTPQDVAPSVWFLLSDDAAYITGHNLVIDGGWTIV